MNDPKTLLAALKSDNQFWRLHAQRLLVERGKADVAAELIKLVGDKSVDAIGLNAAAIHALWALHGLGMLEGKSLDPNAFAASIGALKHPSAGVRRNALQVLPSDKKSAEAIIAAKLMRDPDAFVRLAAFLSLSDMPRSAETADALVGATAFNSDDLPNAHLADAAVGEAPVGATAINSNLLRDAHLADAAVIAAASQDLEYLKALAKLDLDAKSNRRTENLLRRAVASLLPIARKVAEHYARGGPDETISEIVIALSNADSRIADSIIDGLIAGWPRNRPAKLSAEAETALAGLATKLPANAVGQLASLADRWGSKALDRQAGLIAESLLKTVRDDSQTETARLDAAPTRRTPPRRPRRRPTACSP